MGMRQEYGEYAAHQGPKGRFQRVIPSDVVVFLHSFGTTPKKLWKALLVVFLNWFLHHLFIRMRQKSLFLAAARWQDTSHIPGI